MISPAAPIRLVKGIGDAVAEKLERLELRTVGDLLRWYPRTYIDGSQPVPLASVELGRLVAVKVTVISFYERPTKNRHMKLVEVKAMDETGSINLTWFNQGYLKQKLLPGTEWICIGVCSLFSGKLTMSAPLVEKEPRILAVYAQTAGVSSKMFRNYIEWCLENVDVDQRAVPVEVSTNEGLLTSAQALKKVHVPIRMEDTEAAQAALAFEESFWFFVRLAAAQHEESTDEGIPLMTDVPCLQRLVASLPFELTAGQKRAIWDGVQDMARPRPMTRLLNGDVGSGKTVVAALLSAVAAKAGKRSVVVAPTEILAMQHVASIGSLLAPHGIRVGIYTASRKDDISALDVIIGTHALFQQNVTIPDLAFVTIDEQHRFGVRQRQLLRQGRIEVPHLLSMTATPIPRTLALVLYGDLAISFLGEKPKGRLPIITERIRASDRRRMYGRIQDEITAGRQVFVICPLIEEKTVQDPEDGMKITVLSPDEQAAAERKTVMAEAERLKKEFPGFGRIEVIHGKMKAKEKDAVMGRMANGEVSVLVATSVVEVGVDVPNASVMVIEDAERFGLAQLHQFRGRVGRGRFQSYCFLCPARTGKDTDRRLDALVRTEDGFKLAQTDLELRGPGEFIGKVQSGLPDLRMASLTDIQSLTHVKGIVDDYIVKHPEFLRGTLLAMPAYTVRADWNRLDSG